MHTYRLIDHDLTDMSEGYMVTEVTTHKEVKPSLIQSNEEDRKKINPASIISIWPIIRIGSLTLFLAELGQRR